MNLTAPFNLILILTMMAFHDQPLVLEKGGTSLMRAAYQGDENGVARELAKAVDVNARDKFGRTALLLAVMGSYDSYGDMITSEVPEMQQRIATALIKKDANVDLADNTGLTPLMRAAGWRQKGMLDLLLASGATIGLRDKANRTALTWAARDGEYSGVTDALLTRRAEVGVTEALLLKEFDRARALISSGGALNVRGPFGETPLMIAAEEAQVEIVQELLNRGVEINAQDETESTALLLCISGRDQFSLPGGSRISWKDFADERCIIAELLLKSGARADIGGNDGCSNQRYRRKITPVMRACDLERMDIFRVILAHPGNLEVKNDEGNNALHLAVRGGNSEAVKLLLAAGAKVDSRNREGQTSLFKAVERTAFEIVELLLAAGADINARDKRGKTPLHKSREPAVTQFLLAHGAKLLVGEGSTAYTEALYHRDHDIAAMLKALQPPPAFFDAVYLNDLPMLRSFLKKGASPNLARNSESAVGIAAGRCSPEIVKALIDAGAKVNTQNSLRHTPLSHCLSGDTSKPYDIKEELRLLAVVKLLIKAGAKVNGEDIYPGLTPVLYAVRFGSLPLVRLLIESGAMVSEDEVKALESGSQSKVAPEILKALRLAVKQNVPQRPARH